MKSLYYDALLKECAMVEPNAIQNDWDHIFSVYDKSNQLDILEKFEFNSENPTRKGVEHRYTIETKSGKTFNVLISYYNTEVSYEIANSNETLAKQKINNTLANEFHVLKDKLKTNESKICLINFIDSNARNIQTNEVKYESFEVFTSLKDSLMDSLLNRNMIENLGAISIRISKNELKRRELYINMFNRYIRTYFPNMFEDDLSNETYLTIYFCK